MISSDFIDHKHIDDGQVFKLTKDDFEELKSYFQTTNKSLKSLLYGGSSLLVFYVILLVVKYSASVSYTLARDETPFEGAPLLELVYNKDPMDDINIFVAIVQAQAKIESKNKHFLRQSLLLYGPAGTGKTVLSQEIASIFKAEYYGIKADSLVDPALGQTGKTISEIFTAINARAESGNKVVLFIDEIDKLVGKREPGKFSIGVESFLNHLEKSLNNKNIIFIGATNLYESIDRAVLRSGRMNWKQYIGYVDEAGCTAYIDYISSKPEVKEALGRIWGISEGYYKSKNKSNKLSYAILGQICNTYIILPPKHFGENAIKFPQFVISRLNEAEIRL